MTDNGQVGGIQAEGSEQDGAPALSTHNLQTVQAPPSSASSPHKVELELRLLEALEIYHPAKLQGMHKHFVLFGLMEYLRRRLNKQFTADEVLDLLDRFYNLDMLKPDDDEVETLNQVEDFSLPSSVLKDDSKDVQ